MSDFEKELQLFGLLYADKPATETADLPLTGLVVATAGGRESVILVEAAVDDKAGVPPAKVELIVLIRDQDRTPVVSRKWELESVPSTGERP